MVVDGGDLRPFPHLDTEAAERRARGVAELRRKRRQDRVARFDQDDPRLARVDGSEFVAQRLPRNFRERAGQLDAGRTAADQDERQQFLLPRRVRFALGALEREQDRGGESRGHPRAS